MATIERALLSRDDVAHWDGVTRTTSRVDATGGTVTGLNFGDEVDVLQVFGSGTDRTLATINDAITRLGGANATLLFSPGTWTITDNLTIPANCPCHIPAGCIFSIDSGKVLTFSAPIFANLEVFTSGSGSYILSSDSIAGGQALLKRTADEITASATPVNYQHVPGFVIRYGTNTTPGTTDMTAALGAAIDWAGVANGEVTADGSVMAITTMTKTVSNVTITGPMELLITTSGIKLVGDFNRITGIIVHKSTKSVASTPTSFTDAGIGLNGDNCYVSECEVYNMHGPGILPSGRNISVVNNMTHDNEMGIILAAECRDCVIDGNHVVDNGIDTSSGFEGILSLRNAAGIVITNNFIKGSGEHGIYFQGQRGVISNNIVLTSGADGIKFGSHQTDLFTYAGEDINKWVDATDYGCSDIVVSNNFVADSAGAEGVYVQPNMRRMTIENNILVNNDIRIVYFNNTSPAELEDIFDIKVLNNSIKGTTVATGNASRIEVSATFGVRIIGNDVEGRISTFAPNSATTPRLSQVLTDAKIADNQCDRVQSSRTNKCRINNNTMVFLNVPSNSTNTIAKGNTITEQDALMVTTRFLEFSHNDVVTTGNIRIFEGTELMETCIGNRFVGNSYTGNQFFNGTTTTNKTTPTGVIFSDNYIECTGSSRPLKLSGSLGVISGNVLVNDGTNDFAMDIEGSSLMVSGNALNAGSIQFRQSDSFAIGNLAGITQATGKTNIMGRNSKPLALQDQITAVRTITANETGMVFYLNSGTGFAVTLPAVAAGLEYTFISKQAPGSTSYTIITDSGDNHFYGTIVDITDTTAFNAQDTFTFVQGTSLVSDRVEISSDGTRWYCKAVSGASNGITTSA